MFPFTFAYAIRNFLFLSKNLGLTVDLPECTKQCKVPFP